MSDKVKIVVMWIAIIVIGVAAFVLALNVTGDSMDAGDSVTDVTIELNPGTTETQK